MGFKDLTDRRLGVALRWRDIERYPELILENFNSITPEYEGAFNYIHKSDIPNWQNCDAIYSFCCEHGIAFRMTPTTQISPKFVPKWVDNPVKHLKGFVEEVVTRYPKCVGFNLVNEFIADNGLIIEQSYWYQALGPEYYKVILGWAKEANSNAKLFIEDHRIQYGRRWLKMYDIVQDLKGFIDGVGIHGHHDLPSPLQLPSIVGWESSFKQLGLTVDISEISLTKGKFTFVDDLIFEEFYAAFIKKLPNKAPLTIWGFLENVHNNRRVGIFDLKGDPNASYRGIEKGLKGSSPLFNLASINLFNVS
jgi:GH35 family endo-1,4-beta-xylanase